MELKTSFPNKKGILQIAEFSDSAIVKTKGSTRSNKANRCTRVRHKIESQVHNISRKVEQQMSREQYRRMKKLGLV